MNDEDGEWDWWSKEEMGWWSRGVMGGRAAVRCPRFSVSDPRDPENMLKHGHHTPCLLNDFASVSFVFSRSAHSERSVFLGFSRLGKFGFVRFRSVSSGFSRLFCMGGVGQTPNLDCGVWDSVNQIIFQGHTDFPGEQSAQKAVLWNRWLCIGFKKAVRKSAPRNSGICVTECQTNFRETRRDRISLPAFLLDGFTNVAKHFRK